METYKYTHYLITRFNVRMDTMLTNQLDQIDITSDEEYLEERFRLFFCYTVPSVIAQTDRNFKWIILLSSNTPEIFKERISKLVISQNDLIVPLYITDNENYLNVLNKYICINTETDIYITSRVDNDDALNVCYIEKVHEFVASHPLSEYALVFDNGYQLNEKNDFAVLYYFPTNHFSSLVSVHDKERIKTVIEFNHMEIGRNFNVINVNNSNPMWLEVIHQTNVTNRMHIKLNSYVLDKNALRCFGLDKQIIEISVFKKIVILCLQRIINLVRLFEQYGIKKSLKKIVLKIECSLK